MGIRQAFSQAYRPQANGRAERAGRQVLDWLAKLTAEEGLGWVEALPVMLRQYHDAVGESGYSPYEIVFGRPRNLAGIPREPPAECEDVRAFFDRQEMVAEKVAKVLNDKHQVATERINRQRPARPPMEVGTPVWVYKHKRVGGYKTKPRWWGPATIKSRVGDSSYVVEWPEGTQEVHLDDLKVYEAQEFVEEGEDLWFVKGDEGGPRDQEDEMALVEDIRGHRVNEFRELEFLVKWSGWGEEWNSWEPSHKLARGCGPWLTYCARQDLRFRPFDLMPWRGPEASRES